MNTYKMYIHEMLYDLKTSRRHCVGTHRGRDCDLPSAVKHDYFRIMASSRLNIPADKLRAYGDLRVEYIETLGGTPICEFVRYA